MQDEERERFIQSVADFALGTLSTWQRPKSLESVGLSFPEVFDRFEVAVSNLRTDIKNRLSLWSSEELLKVSPKSDAPALNPLFDRGGRLGSLAAKIARMKREVPQDFLGGWVHADVQVEPTYWAPFRTYTLEQAILLSVGRDPRKSAGLDVLFKTYGRSDEGDEMLYFLEDRLEQVASALGCDPSNYKSSVDVAAFFNLIEWATIKIDPKFRRMLREARGKIPSNPSLESDTSQRRSNIEALHGSSRKVHARIVTAICMKKYGLSEDGANLGKVSKAVENDVLFAGLGCSDKVIRVLLRDGLEELRDAIEEPRH